MVTSFKFSRFSIGLTDVYIIRILKLLSSTFLKNFEKNFLGHIVMEMTKVYNRYDEAHDTRKGTQGAQRVKNGWLFRWWNHFRCGAVCGHVYRLDAESTDGHYRAFTCTLCGKQTVA